MVPFMGGVQERLRVLDARVLPGLVDVEFDTPRPAWQGWALRLMVVPAGLLAVVAVQVGGWTALGLLLADFTIVGGTYGAIWRWNRVHRVAR